MQLRAKSVVVRLAWLFPTVKGVLAHPCQSSPIRGTREYRREASQIPTLFSVSL